MTRAVVGLGANLGANLGDAAATVRQALAALEGLPGTQVLGASRLYRTAAWGVTTQPDFINAAALLDTTLAPRDLLDALLALERRFGRTRVAGERWGPRILDLDLLLADATVVDAPGLRLPHPHLHERAFALVPLLEVWPDAVIPGIGPARDCAAAMAGGGIEALP